MYLWIFEMDYEDLEEDEDFPEDIIVPTGSYTTFEVKSGFDMPSGSLFRTDFDCSFGGFFDGWRLDLGVEPKWNVSRYLEMSSEYEINVVRFPNRNQGFNAPCDSASNTCSFQHGSLSKCVIAIQ